ncbi:MAG: PEP/pyruvate-binding domain-containing protein, partial [Candidatus Omnitrophota bacterium]
KEIHAVLGEVGISNVKKNPSSTLLYSNTEHILLEIRDLNDKMALVAEMIPGVDYDPGKGLFAEEADIIRKRFNEALEYLRSKKLDELSAYHSEYRIAEIERILKAADINEEKWIELSDELETLRRTSRGWMLDKIERDLSKVRRDIIKAECLGCDLSSPEMLTLQMEVNRMVAVANIKTMRQKGPGRYIIDLSELGSIYRQVAGNKAAEVAEVMKISESADSYTYRTDSGLTEIRNILKDGFDQVPSGFVISSLAVYSVIQENSAIRPDIEALISGNVAPEEKIEKLTELLLAKGKIPEFLKEMIAEKYSSMAGESKEPIVITRSTSQMEDLLDETRPGVRKAGKYLSFECVKGIDQIKKNIFKHLAHFWVTEGDVNDLHPILVQEMLFDLHSSFVANSVDSAEKNWNVANIDAVLGLGRGVVEGGEGIAIHTFKADNEGRITGRIVPPHNRMWAPAPSGIGIKLVDVPAEMKAARALTEEQVAKIAKLARAFQKYYRFPVNIEGGVTKDGKIVIFQVRPDSTLKSNSYSMSGTGIHSPPVEKIIALRKQYLAAENPSAEELGKVDPAAISELIDTNINELYQARKSESEVRDLEYKLVERLVQFKGYHYDRAREVVMDLRLYHRRSDVVDKLDELFFEELKQILRERLFEEGEFNRDREKISYFVENFHNLQEIREGKDIPNGNLFKSKPEYRDAVITWEERIDRYAYRYFTNKVAWDTAKTNAEKVIFNNVLVRHLSEKAKGEMYAFIRYLVPRLYENIPPLKRLRRPTIVLIGGTTASGKSTSARSVAKNLGMPYYFSADPIREVQRKLIPKDTNLSPADKRSSFQEDPAEKGFIE